MLLNYTGFSVLYAQGWVGRYGGNGGDIGYSIIETGDGGYAMVGLSSSFPGFYYNIWLVKLNNMGNIEWQKTLGSTLNSGAYSIVKTGDGGYALAGYVEKFGVYAEQYWTIKLSSNWDIQWQYYYGDSKAYNDRAYAATPTSDGGFATAGYTSSYGQGEDDIWVFRYSSTGQTSWQRTYGGILNDLAYSIIQTQDGGYAIAGATESLISAGMFDMIVLKLDADGNIQWQKTYGTIGDEWAYSIIQTMEEAMHYVGLLH